MDRPIFKNLLCDGPLCCPWEHGSFCNDDVMGTVGCLTIVEGENITKHGWEYRYVDGHSMALCPDCQKEMDKP